MVAFVLSSSSFKATFLVLTRVKGVACCAIS